MLDLTGRVAVVTGGARGIGLGIANAFADAGARVTVLDVVEPDRSQGAGIGYIAADVADEDQVADAFARIRAGHRRVDVLVNNAGINEEYPVETMPIAEWDRVLAVNLRSAFLCTREVVAPMREQRWGRIINIASQLGQIGAEGMSHYCASKAGLIGFTKAVARELAPHNVLVNAIAPGPIQTAMLAGESPQWVGAKLASLPIQRFGEVGEVTGSALFLASEYASYYVGQTLGPNGGDVLL